MDQGDRWIYLDGPEPDHVRPLLDLLRGAPATAEENALFEREFFDRLDGPAPSAEGEEDEASAATTKPRATQGGAGPATQDSATARSPVLDDRGPAPSVTAPAAEAPAPAGVPPPPEGLARTAQSPRGVAACAARTVVPIPRLSVNQYASLCAELAVTPERAGEILGRYQVADTAAHRELNADWARRLEVELGLRAEFVAKVAEFVGWLRVVRGR